MPELPEMQALAERLDAFATGKTVASYKILGFTGLKTVAPAPDDIVGGTINGVTRRGKLLVIQVGQVRLLIHLSQAGRLDIEEKAKSTKPRGSVVRLVLGDGSAMLLREHGTQRKAGWWLLAAGEDGPLGSLGPEPGDEAFGSLVMEGDSTRQLHSMLRDQHVVAG